MQIEILEWFRPIFEIVGLKSNKKDILVGIVKIVVYYVIGIAVYNQFEG